MGGLGWGGVGVKARFGDEFGADRVLVDVSGVSGVIVGVGDAAAVVTSFPHVDLGF